MVGLIGHVKVKINSFYVHKKCRSWLRPFYCSPRVFNLYKRYIQQLAFHKILVKSMRILNAINNSSPMQSSKLVITVHERADLSNFDESQYELLCLNRDNGGRDSFSNYATCNVVMAPSRTWLSAKDFLSDVSIAHTPLSLAQLLNTRGDLFNIYGEFLKNNNVIFSNAATGLATTEKMDFEKFKTIHDVISSCGIGQ